MIKHYVNIHTIFDLYNQGGTPKVVDFFVNPGNEFEFTGGMQTIQKEIYEACLKSNFKKVRELIADSYMLKTP